MPQIMMNSRRKQVPLYQGHPLPARLRDKWWRLTHLYKIRDKDGNLRTFFPNIIQLKHIRDRGAHRYCRICKARQHGITTYYCIDYLDESLWVPGTASAIIAHEQKALLKIFDIVKRAYDNIPELLKPITDANNSNELKFEYRFDGAKLDSGIYVALKVRSGTVQNLHITEGAYIKDRQELKSGSMQAVPKTGRITEESTANGMNDFYDDYMDAWNNPNPGDMDYRAFFYAWFENPDYRLPGVLTDKTKQEVELQLKYQLDDPQLIWRRWKMKDLIIKQEGVGLSGEQLFKQEYPSSMMEAFQSGSGNVFSLEKLEATEPVPPLTLAQIQQIIQEKGYSEEYKKTAEGLFASGVWFWELPEPGKEYVAGVDPSDGQGSDYGDIDAWGKKLNEDGKYPQVAQFYGKLLPDELAEMTKRIAVFYNRAFVGVENNMLSTILFLVKIYDNYYMKVTIDEKTQNRTKKVGWNTNSQSRDKMIDDYLIHHSDDALLIRSGVTLKEMKTFVRKVMPSGAYKREHADGRFDDALFGGFIALQMILYKPPRAQFVTGSASTAGF